MLNYCRNFNVNGGRAWLTRGLELYISRMEQFIRRLDSAWGWHKLGACFRPLPTTANGLCHLLYAVATVTHRRWWHAALPLSQLTRFLGRSHSIWLVQLRVQFSDSVAVIGLRWIAQRWYSTMIYDRVTVARSCRICSPASLFIINIVHIVNNTAWKLIPKTLKSLEKF